MLHAYKLTFNHPITGEKITITAPLPEDFMKWSDHIQKI
jgi:hypothetical protein